MSDGERHPHFCDCDSCINGAHGMRITDFKPRVVKDRGHKTRPAFRRLPTSEQVSAIVPAWQRRMLEAEASARGGTLSDVLREVVDGWAAARGAAGMAAE